MADNNHLDVNALLNQSENPIIVALAMFRDLCRESMDAIQEIVSDDTQMSTQDKVAAITDGISKVGEVLTQLVRRLR